MRILALPLLALAACASAPSPAPTESAWPQSLVEWRARAEKSLRADNGWLTLAGRYVMKPGANTFGTGPGNDIVFPPGLGPERMGTITIADGKVKLSMAPGLTVRKEGMDLHELVLGTDLEHRDWVSRGRMAMHVIKLDDRYVLRLADNESQVRKGFHSRQWYAPDPAYRVNARYVPYPPGRKVTIVNVIDETSEEPVPGYIEFEVGGQVQRLDAVGEDEGLFFVLRDATAGDTTYRPGRFLYIASKPEPGKTFVLDLNRLYNPPCAFSQYTTCPLPPKQNILKVRLEAGEKYPPDRAG